MLIIAHHNINNPEEFWKAAKEKTQNLPSNLKLHAVYPSQDKKTGTCIWEAKTTQEVQQFLDREAGKFAKNFCYEVNEKEAMGLSAFRKAAAPTA